MSELFIPVQKGAAICPICGRRVRWVESPDSLDVRIMDTCAHYEGTGIIGQQAIVFRVEDSNEVTRDAQPR